MGEYSIAGIEREIMLHKKNCAAQEHLESQIRRVGEAMPSHLLERLSGLSVKNEMVKNWLSILSEDEEYVIRRHLIDGLTWPRLEAEHLNIWKEYGKSKRTLMRYKRNALEKIHQFIYDEDVFFKANC
jgi:hypothetical protein